MTFKETPSVQEAPVDLGELPHPRELSPTSPFAQSEDWFACGPPPVASQGWKLYVPATIRNARELIELVYPLASAAGLHFKYIKTAALLRRLNAGLFGYSQVGKTLVIYMPRPNEPFLNTLKNALVPYRHQCPAVPCAIPFGDGLPLYYRYGCYKNQRLRIGEDEIEDDRTDANAAVPAGIEDLLRKYTSLPETSSEVESFLLRYPAYEAIQQQGKGGIFKGLNLESPEFQEVILKVGYYRGMMQLDGGDGCTLLRRELRFYRELAHRGLASLAPRLVDALDTSCKVILVLECVAGTNLLLRRLENRLTVQHLEQCWNILAQLHANGLYLRDAKLANFLADDDGHVHILDFETAGLLGDEPSPIRTFHLRPAVSDVRTADLAHFLASVLYPYSELRPESPPDPTFDLLAWANRDPETETAVWACHRLRALMSCV